MATTVVLAVCLDPLISGTQCGVWSSARYIFLSADSIKEAIHRFNAGDFDLVPAGESLPAGARERLTHVIRATGSHVPVVCIAGSSGRHDSFADATFEQVSSELLPCIGGLLKSKACIRTAPTVQNSSGTLGAAAQNKEG
jgi:hypothetical protein